MRPWRPAAGALVGALLIGCGTAPPPPPPQASTAGEHIVTFTCEGGERLTVRFQDGHATLIDPRGRSFELRQQESGSGILYAGQGQTLRGKGEEMTWTAAGRQPEACSAADSPLAGSRWRLIGFRAADGAASAPANPDRYVMELMVGGRLAMQLDCNRATGRWEAHPSGAGGGSITLGAPAMTRAACPGDSWDGRIARDIGMARTYALTSGRLDVALAENGGVYSWARLPATGGPVTGR
jgi:heat shock protein HslJ